VLRHFIDNHLSFNAVAAGVAVCGSGASSAAATTSVSDGAKGEWAAAAGSGLLTSGPELLSPFPLTGSPKKPLKLRWSNFDPAKTQARCDKRTWMQAAFSCVTKHIKQKEGKRLIPGETGASQPSLALQE
jgi:hypothetical protein